MDEAEIAAILNSLAKHGIDISPNDGIDVVRDFFANRQVENDSDIDDDEHDEQSPVTAVVALEESQSDVPQDVPDVVVIEQEFPDINNLYTDILNDDEEKTVVSFLQDRCCGCHQGPDNKSCLAQFSVRDIVENRLNCFELDYMQEHENKLNTVIVAELNALLHRDEKLMCSNLTPRSQKHRSKQRMDYKFRGYSVCMKGFLFLHGIGRKRLRLLRKRVNTFGVQAVKHGNTGKVPQSKTQTFDDVKKVVTFLRNYSENNALILPGRVPGHSNSNLQLLPSWETKTTIHDLYKLSCIGNKPVGYHSFIRIWNAALPNIVIQLPRTDLCLTCQQDIIKMSRLANMDEESRSERIQKSLDHLKLVRQERKIYTDIIQKCKLVISTHPTKQLGSLPPGMFSGCSHISFDFAQQVHIPNLPDQPGPLYFLTPYKLGLFGVNNEAAGRQVNYIIPESVATGKGPNAIASMLHHYLENYSLGESVLYIHADNCVGQNKNNVIMQYLCWRILAGLHKYIKIMFMPVGHTKFAPDGGFGLIKSKFRRSLVSTATELAECIRESTPASKMNQAELVGTESGRVNVPTYDWQSMFHEMQMKPIAQITKQHHFIFSSVNPGCVSMKTRDDTEEVQFAIIDEAQPVNPASLPHTVQPPGLSAERQWYLFESIRPLVPEAAQDVICPKPSVERRTFAQARTEQDASTPVTTNKKVNKRLKLSEQQQPTTAKETRSSNEAADLLILRSPKRKPPICSYCSESGHANRIIRGKPTCPRRIADSIK